MPTIAEFYADKHLALGYGVKDKLHSFHSGQDVNGWKLGTPIPNLYAGKVVKVAEDGNLGIHVTVKSDGLWLTYCHLKEQCATVGQDLARGEAVGPLGTSGYSTGPHLHLMASRVNDPSTYRNLIDPLPFIIAARQGGAGGGGIAPIPQEEEMKAIPIIFDQHRAGKDDSKHPDFASSGVLWPWGFEQTSQGYGPRAPYTSATALGGTLGILAPEQHRDVNALAMLRLHGVPQGSGDGPTAEAIAEAVEARLRDEHDDLLQAIAAARSGAGYEEFAAAILSRLDELPDEVRQRIGVALTSAPER